MSDFIIEPNKDQKDSVTFTVRTTPELLAKYDAIAASTKMSRNKLINLALEYALSNLKIKED